MGRSYHILFPCFLLFTFASVQLVQSQFFDPILDDKTYLDNIQKEVTTEVEEAKSELIDQAKVVENVTRAYIAAKLKENVFKVLRVMAENELNKVSIVQSQRPKSPKQETEDEEEEEVPKTTPLTGLGTAVKVNQQVFGLLYDIPTQVFSFLGEAFKIIFAGGKPKTKKYVEPAEILMSKSQDVQILGVVSLLARDEQNLEMPVVDKNATGSKSGSGSALSPTYIYNRPSGKGTKKGSKDEDSSEGDALISALSQDARIIDLFAILGLRKKGGSAFFTQAATKNETLSGFDDESPKKPPQRFNVEQFVRNFKKSLSELQANVPDIYRGVQEAYKLLETVRGVATRLEEYVSDIFK